MSIMLHVIMVSVFMQSIVTSSQVALQGQKLPTTLNIMTLSKLRFNITIHDAHVECHFAVCCSCYVTIRSTMPSAIMVSVAIMSIMLHVIMASVFMQSIVTSSQVALQGQKLPTTLNIMTFSKLRFNITIHDACVECHFVVCWSCYVTIRSTMPSVIMVSVVVMSILPHVITLW